VCPRAQHRHGTRAAYVRDECRCRPCRAANNADQRAFQRLRAEQRWSGTSVWTSPVGTRRRLQALTAAGWSTALLAERMGVTKSAVAQLRTTAQARVLVATATDVAALYEQCRRRTPSGGYQWRVQRYAHARGWPSPAEWDGLDLDDPTVMPGRPRPAVGAQREYEATWRGVAACTDRDPHLFDLPSRRDPARVRQAAALCSTCLVTTRCLVEAIKAGDVGLRGGVLLVRPNQSSARLEQRRLPDFDWTAA
jgi:hypothetical protein